MYYYIYYNNICILCTVLVYSGVLKYYYSLGILSLRASKYIPATADSPGGRISGFRCRGRGFKPRAEHLTVSLDPT